MAFIPEPVLEQLAGEQFEAKNLQQALEIMKLAATAYPDVPNVYDGLADNLSCRRAERSGPAKCKKGAGAFTHGYVRSAECPRYDQGQRRAEIEAIELCAVAGVSCLR